MNVKKIYFDMDGVLADFDRGVRELCGMKPLDQMTASDEDNDRLWEAISRIDHYYDRLEPIPGSDAMLRMLVEKYGDRCEILTGIPKPRRNVRNAGADKENWMGRFFGPEIKVNIVYRQDKKDYCHGKDYILIDDFQENIEEWVSYGGTGILFKDAESAMQELKSLGIL